MYVRLVVTAVVSAALATIVTALVLGSGSGDGGTVEREPCADPVVRAIDRTSTSFTLPSALTPGIDPAEATVLVHLDPASGLMVNGTHVADDQLDALFERARDHNPDTQVLFEVAPTIPHARVVELMDRARTAGLSRMAISTTDP